MLLRLRPWIRACVFVFMFLVPILNLFEIYSVTGTFYAVNMGGLGASDPSAILQSLFSLGELTIPLLTAALFPILLALIFGRIWCGWMCPYLVLSDLVEKLRSRLSRNRLDSTLPVADPLRANVARFGFLALGTAVAGAIGIPILNYFNAPGVASTEAMILVKEHRFSVEILFILAILALEFTVLPRFWCRLFCPTGTIVSVFKTPLTLHVGTGILNPKAPCCKEHYCQQSCPMGLDPYKESGNLLCVNCGLCVKTCASGRLRFRGFESAS
jgi:ferredoxin-type protein NapH